MKDVLTRDLIKLLMLEISLRQRDLEERPVQREEQFQQNKPIEKEGDFPLPTRRIEAASLKQYVPMYKKAFSVPRTDDYTFSVEQKKQDFSNNVPLKNLKWHPTSMMGGVLGYTYLGAGTINKRDDLAFNPVLSYEVDVHEGIHTEWEYETRVLTEWMLSYDPHFRQY